VFAQLVAKFCHENENDNVFENITFSMLIAFAIDDFSIFFNF